MIEYDGKEAEEISSLLYSVQNEQGTSHLFGTDKCLELTQEIIKIINESNRLEKLVMPKIAEEVTEYLNNERQDIIKEKNKRILTDYERGRLDQIGWTLIRLDKR